MGPISRNEMRDLPGLVLEIEEAFNGKMERLKEMK